MLTRFGEIEVRATRRRLVAIVLAVAISVLFLPRARPEDIKKAVKATGQNSSAPAQPDLSELLARMSERHQWQASHLQRVSVTETYTLKKNKDVTVAEEVVRMEYTAPKTETFEIISGKGSKFIRGHIFRRLMRRQEKRVASDKDPDNLITPSNYSFDVIGHDETDGAQCTVLHVTPKRKATDLFAGRVWIDEQDSAIVKVAGRLAKSPSFWIKRVDFVREYQKIGSFWLLSNQEATASVRVFGPRKLLIKYENYIVNGTSRPEENK